MEGLKYKQIVNMLNGYIDMHGCIVCIDYIQKQPEFAAGIEDSTHKAYFISTICWLLGEELPARLDFDKYIRGNEIIRHPMTRFTTSADQYFFLHTLFLRKHPMAEVLYKHLRSKFFRCPNGNFMPPARMSAILRARGLRWFHVPIVYLFDMGHIFYLLFILAFYRKRKMTHKIQPLLFIEIAKKRMYTLPMKICNWIYYKLIPKYDDKISTIFHKYFYPKGVGKDYSPPIDLLIKYYLEKVGYEDNENKTL